MEDQIKLSKAAKGRNTTPLMKNSKLSKKQNKKTTESFKAKVVEVEFISTPPTFF